MARSLECFGLGLRPSNVTSLLVDAARHPTERRLWAALRFQQAATAVAHAGHIQKCLPIVDRPPVWRRDNDRGAFALTITARGLAALGIEKSSASPEMGVTSGASEVDGDLAADAAFAAILASRKTSMKRGAAPRKGSGAEVSSREGSNNRASSRCFSAERAAPFQPSSKQRAGSRTRCAGSLRAWCAKKRGHAQPPGMSRTEFSLTRCFRVYKNQYRREGCR
jgi:hypothetical protein